jgi:retinol-binding protein 3
MANGTILAKAALICGTLAVLIASTVASPFVANITIDSLITDLANSIRENYVFPEKGEEAAEMLEQNAEAGEYEGLEGQQLAQRLTQDLQTVTHDLHFGIRPAPAEAPAGDIQIMPQRRRSPIAKIERLDGNIGYLDFRAFEPLDRAEPQIHAMMQILQGSDALIIDMRRNGGGHPETVQLICSYLFPKDKPVHLNSLYFRPTDETTEWWTEPEKVKSEGFADVPVWVLTSRRTFSAAEEFTYNLQTRKRATIVGETTGGGAHPVDGFRVGEFVAMIPVGRAINPVTGTNWEGTGVKPDIEVPAPKALAVAIELALDQLINSENPAIASEAEWALLTNRIENESIDISEQDMIEVAGNYGQRQITLKDGTLWYNRSGVSRSPTRLLPAGDDVFVLDGMNGFRLEVDRTPDGGVIKGLRGVYQAGHTDYSKREN